MMLLFWKESGFAMICIVGKYNNLGLLTGLHNLSSLVFQFLQLLAELSHGLLVLLQLRLHAVHALLTLLQVAADTQISAFDQSNQMEHFRSEVWDVRRARMCKDQNVD